MGEGSRAEGAGAEEGGGPIYWYYIRFLLFHHEILHVCSTLGLLHSREHLYRRLPGEGLFFAGTCCVSNGPDPSWEAGPCGSKTCACSPPLWTLVCHGCPGEEPGTSVSGEGHPHQPGCVSSLPYSNPRIPCEDRVSLDSNVIDTYIQSPGSFPHPPLPSRRLSTAIQGLETRCQHGFVTCARG